MAKSRNSSRDKTTRRSARSDAAASRAGKAIARSSAVGKLSASRILGPAPGPRTVSDETILEAVRAAIRKRSARVDA